MTKFTLYSFSTYLSTVNCWKVPTFLPTVFLLPPYPTRRIPLLLFHQFIKKKRTARQTRQAANLLLTFPIPCPYLFSLCFVQLHPFNIGSVADHHRSAALITTGFQIFGHYPYFAALRADKYTYHDASPLLPGVFPSLLLYINLQEEKDLLFLFFCNKLVHSLYPPFVRHDKKNRVYYLEDLWKPY